MNICLLIIISVCKSITHIMYCRDVNSINIINTSSNFHIDFFDPFIRRKIINVALISSKL